MIGYASRTGTRRNLAALREAGWRLLVTPACVRTEGFSHALDNGAWSAFCQQKPWDERAFCMALSKVGSTADFTVAPDIVAGGMQSLDLSLKWLPRLLDSTSRVLIAVQDGMSATDVEPYLSDRVGIFVGGSTEWKLSSLPQWSRLSLRVGSYLHVGRVNSARRIRLCALHSVHSVDGTSASRFAKSLPRLDNAIRQPSLFNNHEV